MKENDTLDYQLITSDSALQRICEQARTRKEVALDTEFIRTHTYYPQLGLMQLYDGENLSLIDPLVIREWQPFCQLLQDKNVVKFLHAGGEDIEVFLHFFNQLATPMIDSQILAAFTGHNLSCGLATLVKQYCGVELNKNASRTDWLMRPLSEEQCHYAAADVFHLLPLAKQLVAETVAAGWMEAVEYECLLLVHRRSQILDPALAYRKIARAWQLSIPELACLQKLAEWRLNEARERNLAVNFVIREERLWKVARYRPTSLGELNSLGLSRLEVHSHGKALLESVAQGNLAPEKLLLPLATTLFEQHNYKEAFKEIKKKVQLTSLTCGLNSELLASRRQINQLLKWHWQPKSTEQLPELITAWRAELLASPLQEILKKY